MTLPADYLERTYAGVLGKLIGVYLGRPFEGWTYPRIMAELGEIRDYVHERLKMPLIVTDDDVSGTFTFLRALADYGYSRDLTPRAIGQTWLNYIIERRTVLWWGGLGNSTEHTAYLRLKQGVPAPDSGSIACNGKTVAEQIGAQIFIDGWAMVAPGDPALAVDLAQRAASVSHAGEAIYGAQVIAAMEAQAYVEPDINRLLDMAVSFIPADSIIYRLINDIRNWRAQYDDWRIAREQIVAHYGYDKYGGNCHIVPNHALIILSLLYGDDDFDQSLMIVNTCGWDTDCNAGNVGCLLGIKNGLAGINARWRDPVADRLYLSTADGGRAITDAVAETCQVVNTGRVLAGQAPLYPKNGARFHFDLPGSVQGFQATQGQRATLSLENVDGHSRTGQRSLALRYNQLAANDPVRAATPTFIPESAINMVGYALLASPTIYPGQTIRAELTADTANHAAVGGQLVLRVYDAQDRLTRVVGPACMIAPGQTVQWTWQVPATDGQPIAEVGVELTTSPEAGDVSGSVYLDYLTWDGIPTVTLSRPAAGGTMWRRAWVDATDQTEPYWPEAYRVVQNSGTGLLIQGARAWTDYTVTATLTPHLVHAAGIAARVQGLTRYYALQLNRNGAAQLVKQLDGERLLASQAYAWALGEPYILRLTVQGQHIRAYLQGQLVFDVEDTDRPLLEGAIALVCDEGRVGCDSVNVCPVAAG
ncbi:MAG: ADP-ribosylglycohydrolase family protein [Anaerolineae bacterium]|nr:ADP-ribosylglycohydrolase family protein [Anaerolineae bacterium]